MTLALHYTPDFKIDDRLNLCKCKESKKYFFYLKIDKQNKAQENFRINILELINKNVKNVNNIQEIRKITTKFCKTSTVNLFYEDINDYISVPINFLCFPLDKDVKTFTEATDIDGLKKKVQVSFENFKNILKPGFKIRLLLKINFQNYEEDYSDILQIKQIIIKKNSDKSIFFPILLDYNNNFIEASTSISIDDNDKTNEEIIETTNINSIDDIKKEYEFQNAELIETNIDGFIYPKSYN